jgi:hypothetical protein
VRRIPARFVVGGVALAIAAAALAVLVAQSLGVGQPTTATGIVIDVQSTSAVDITGFTLRTQDGQLQDYAVGRLDTASPAFPAVHLRSHLISLVPVVVTYEMDGDQRVALRVVDAILPASTSSPLVVSASP